MIRSGLILCVALLAAAPAADAGAAERALCAVCALNGETEPEEVAATREYAGETVNFCSKKCAEAFDIDPAAYIFEPGPAPAIAATSLGGDVLPFIPRPGRIVLVDFWATWCKPCVKSMPEVDALYRELRERGLDVIGVAAETGKDREKNVRKFLGKQSVSYPIAVDREESPAWEAFGVKVLPTMFLIDGNGVIVRRWAGAIDMNDVRQAVEGALRPGASGE
ncbi:MAG TPA: TlpA disulfide reductase family protein [Candidatus Krumholzibacteria bacterium]|nr:TlpA disulfide reductase family protein [Candidatus Krumholzibacteria bacterium]